MVHSCWVRLFLSLCFLNTGISALADVEVVADARHQGEYGLRTTVVGSSQTFLTNSDIDVPDAFRARFYFRLDGLILSETQSVVVFTGQDGSHTELFRARVENVEDQYRLGFEVRLDDGSYAELPTATGPVLNAGWHSVELAWSSEVGGGYFQYLLDGDADQSGLAGLDNDMSMLASVSIGLIDGQGSYSGFVDFDDYESRERGAIGVLCIVSAEFTGQLPRWPTDQSVRDLVTLTDEFCQEP